MTSRSQIRRLVIQGLYNTNLIQQLYEQAAPTPTDPAAATPPPADPAAAPPADPAAAAATPPPATPAAAAPPAAGAPPADPAAAAVPAAPAAAPAVDPAAAAGAAPAAGTAPAVDPMAAMAAAPAAAPPMDPAMATAAPAGAVPAGAVPATPAAPGAPAPGAAPAGAAKPKQPAKTGTAAAEVDKAGQAAISAAEDSLATESLRRRSMKFLIEQDSKQPSIDIGIYAGKIANLIKNYTSLVDVKKNVINQAEKFLDDQFPKNSENLKKQLKDLLRREYHVSLERPEPVPDSYAVGARSSGGGAA